MTTPALRSVPQTGFDEQVIDDADIEAALTEREKAKNSLDAVRKIYDERHAKATAGPGLEELGRQLVERYGSVSAALRATHPDTGTGEHSLRDFQSVMAYRATSAVAS